MSAGSALFFAFGKINQKQREFVPCVKQDVDIHCTMLLFAQRPHRQHSSSSSQNREERADIVS